MKKRDIVLLYVVLLAFTVGAGIFLVSSGAIEPETTDVGVPADEPDVALPVLPVDPSVETDSPLPVDDPIAPRIPVEEGPGLYLVIDDAGHSVEDLRRFIDFPGVFTLAVLPELRYSEETMRIARAAGHSVILHQPMEAKGDHDPGPAAIRVGDDEDVIRQTLRHNIRSLPGIAGVNNHMGSKVTEHRPTMEIIASELARHELFFLDSRTSGETVAEDVSRDLGIPVASRDVFLDNVRDPEAIAKQLTEALAIAKEKGSVVMIGHVTVPELAEVLVERYGEIVEAGYRFLPLEDLYQNRFGINDDSSGG